MKSFILIQKGDFCNEMLHFDYFLEETDRKCITSRKIAGGETNVFPMPMWCGWYVGKKAIIFWHQHRFEKEYTWECHIYRAILFQETDSELWLKVPFLILVLLNGSDWEKCASVKSQEINQFWWSTSLSTLVYRIDVQAQINVQVGKF